MVTPQNFQVSYNAMKVESIPELYLRLPESERLIVDVLRQLIKDHLPEHCREKLSWGVPVFKGNKTICIVWPASVPRGGISEGVLLGFWYGNRLDDADNCLTHGTNKQIFYKIFREPEEIDGPAIVKLLKEAVQLDQSFTRKRK
jgi:hypothetical protein